MSNWPFRFLHAADFHLDTPPFGLDEVPEHLIDRFIEAPYASAERVFETAVAEKVDFVVLAGDLVNSRHSGPRGPLFLLDQFERLAAHGIAVYWSPGRIDPPEAWLPAISLPENVRLFTKGSPVGHVHRRDDTPVARIIGASRSEDGQIRPGAFEPENPGLFTIAVVHGRARLEALKASRLDYWALGGRHESKTLCETMPVVHYPGTPQGRHPEETGPHGCTLVQVDSQRNVQLSPIATDVLRWESQQLTLGEAATRETLEREMSDRIESLRQNAAKTDLLISWRVVGTGPLVAELRRGVLAGELLTKLRRQFGLATPSAWCVGLSADPTDGPPDPWFEEDTIRGEFLRRIHQCQEDADELLGLENALSKQAAGGPIGEMVLQPSDVSRAELLEEAALLGIDLLNGEEPKS